MKNIWAWGANNYGQLGLATMSEQENCPVKIVTSVPGELCRQIVGGGGHTLMLGHDGSVHGTGWNHVGQLGLGHTDPVTQFTKLDLTFCGDTKIVSLAAGWDFSLLLTEHGDVYSCGSNTFGQLGQLHFKLCSDRLLLSYSSKIKSTYCSNICVITSHNLNYSHD